MAARKARGLVELGAAVTVIAPTVGPEMQSLRPSLRTLETRPYRSGDAVGFRLVITATGNHQVDAAVYADAEAAGVWVNSADDPEHSSFILPSVHRDGTVTIAVSTGGASPSLAVVAPHAPGRRARGRRSRHPGHAARRGTAAAAGLRPSEQRSRLARPPRRAPARARPGWRARRGPGGRGRSGPRLRGSKPGRSAAVHPPHGCATITTTATTRRAAAVPAERVSAVASRSESRIGAPGAERDLEPALGRPCHRLDRGGRRPRTAPFRPRPRRRQTCRRRCSWPRGRHRGRGRRRRCGPPS